MHQVELQGDCQCCGISLGEFSFSEHFAERPYLCGMCGNPLSGVLPDLSLHIEFRKHHEVLNREFQQFEDWINRAKDRLLPMFELHKQNVAWQSTWSQWCRPLEFLLSFGHLLHPLPKKCAHVLYPDVKVLHWRHNNDSIESVTNLELPLSSGQQWNISKKIYQDVLWRLHSALIAYLDRSLNLRESSRISRFSTLHLMEHDAYELAYRIFRLTLESSDGDLAPPSSAINLRAEPIVFLPSHLGEEVLGSSLKGIYAAMYSNIFHSIKRMDKKYSTCLSHFDLRGQTLVPHAWWERNGDVHGITVFPNDGIASALNFSTHDLLSQSF